MDIISKWLDSCFDQSDERAPMRAFLFGAGMMAIVSTVCVVATDPTDFRMLVVFLIGGSILGGGCSAMFVLPTQMFVRNCCFSLELCTFIPLKILIGVGLIPFVFIAFALFVGIMAVVTALRVLTQNFLTSHISNKG
jgi:hypothetical protein